MLNAFRCKPEDANLNAQSNRGTTEGTEASEDVAVEKDSTQVRVEESIGSKRLGKSLVQTDTKRSKVNPNLASEPQSQVATKNDDAPVVVTDWDVWTVDNYQHPDFITVRASDTGSTGFKIRNPAKVLVCHPGSYSQDTHGRLFDALRALLLRRACKNALQGLLSYLRKKHGSTRVFETVRYKKRPKVRPSKRKRRRQRGSVSKPLEVENRNEDQDALRKQKRKRELGSELDGLDVSIPFQTRDAACIFAYGYSNQREYKVPSWTRKERIPPAKPGD